MMPRLVGGAIHSPAVFVGDPLFKGVKAPRRPLIRGDAEGRGDESFIFADLKG